MPPRLPAHPDFGDALVAVSRQAKIAFADLRLRPFTREQRVHIAHRRLVPAEDFQRDNPPLDVGAQSGHFAHFDPLIQDLTGLLTEADVQHFSSVLQNNSSAALMLFENTWATRFRDAIVGAKGEVVVSERIPKAVIDELMAETEAASA